MFLFLGRILGASKFVPEEMVYPKWRGSALIFRLVCSAKSDVKLALE